MPLHPGPWIQPPDQWLTAGSGSFHYGLGVASAIDGFILPFLWSQTVPTDTANDIYGAAGFDLPLSVTGDGGVTDSLTHGAFTAFVDTTAMGWNELSTPPDGVTPPPRAVTFEVESDPTWLGPVRTFHTVVGIAGGGDFSTLQARQCDPSVVAAFPGAIPDIDTIRAMPLLGSAVWSPGGVTLETEWADTTSWVASGTRVTTGLLFAVEAAINEDGVAPLSDVVGRVLGSSLSMYARPGRFRWLFDLPPYIRSFPRDDGRGMSGPRSYPPTVATGVSPRSFPVIP